MRILTAKAILSRSILTACARRLRGREPRRSFRPFTAWVIALNDPPLAALPHDDFVLRCGGSAAGRFVYRLLLHVRSGDARAARYEITRDGRPDHCGSDR